MHILFIDESGTIPPLDKSSKDDVFVLGGVVIPEGHWHEVKRDLYNIKVKYEIKGEIKWRYFAKPRNNTKEHSLLHLDNIKKEKLRSEIYNIVTKYKSVKLICAVVDIKKAYSQKYINNDNDLYWYAYKQITERFQYYLQDLSRIVGETINGIIVCDHRQQQADEHLRDLHAKLVDGAKHTHSSYNNLIEGVFIAPSHLSVGIQIADMVGGAVFRKFARNDDRFFKDIASSFRSAPNGSIDGYGLIHFPK